jgi:DNA-binding CsgD family transcriptional regulator
MSEASHTVARGREYELSVIADYVSRASEGRGGVVLIQGPPGIGKTRVLAEATELASAAGLRPLGAKVHEAQLTVPFAPLLDAVLRADPPVGDPVELRRTVEHPALHYWVVHVLQAALEEAAAAGPLVVWLDDLQWADAGTLLALRSLTSNLADVGVVWLLALRSGEVRHPVRDLLRRLDADGAHLLSLDELPADAVRTIVTDVVGARPDAALAGMIEEAQGNPFLLLELLHGLTDEDRLEVTDDGATVRGNNLPRRLTASMQERLEAIGAEPRQLVRLASVLPRRFTASQLANMLHRAPAELVPAIDVALDMDLLVSVDHHLTFRHDLVREAVRESIPAAVRRALEREAAGVLLADGATPAEVATLLLSSAEFGDRDAVAALREAARTLAPSDADVGAELSRRALELLPLGDPERGHLVGETVILLNMAGRFSEAAVLGDDALSEALAAEQESAVRLSLSRMITRPASDRAAENRRSLALSGVQPRSRAAHAAWLSYNLMMSGEPREARAAATAALQTSEVVTDPDLNAICLLTLTLVECCDGHGLRSAARLQELLTMRSQVIGAQLGVIEIQHPNLLAVLGQVEEARRVLAATIARSQQERNGAVLAILTQDAGLISMAAGRLADASAESASVEDLMDDVDAGSMTGWIRMLVVSHLAQHTGEERLARGATDAANRLLDDRSPMVRRWAARVHAVDATQRGLAADAARWLTDDPLTTITPPVPNELDFLVVAAQIAVASADPSLGIKVRAAANRLGSERPGNPLFHAVSSYLEGLLDRNADLLVRAAEELAALERPLLLASAQADAGRQLRADGRRTEAAAILEAAARGFDACDAKASAERVRRGGARARSPRRPAFGWDSLTDSELAVVRLVARGATNRDVAGELSISPHTVSSHLRNAFQKLGVNSRVQLTHVVIAYDR